MRFDEEDVETLRALLADDDPVVAAWGLDLAFKVAAIIAPAWPAKIMLEVMAEAVAEGWPEEVVAEAVARSCAEHGIDLNAGRN